MVGSASAGGWVRAAASRLRPNQLVYKNGCPLSACATLKNSLDGAMQSLLRTMLENDLLEAGVVRGRPPHIKNRKILLQRIKIKIISRKVFSFKIKFL